MNNELVYGYLTESERSYEADMLRSDLELQRIQLAYEMVDAQLQENFRYAELKVIEENGTYADLNYLYEEANKEAKEKKEGLFKRIIGAIQKFFTKLLNKLRGVKPDENSETVEVPKNFDAQKVQQGLNSVDDTANKIINGVRGSAAINGLLLVGSLTGSVQNIIQFLGSYHRNKDDAAKGAKDMKKVPANVAAKLKNQWEKTCNAFNAIFEKDEAKKAEDKFEGDGEYTDKDGTKKSGPLSAMLSVLHGAFDKITGFFFGIFNKKKDNNEEENKDNTNDNNQNTEQSSGDSKNTTNNPENKDTSTKTPEQKPKESKDKVGNQNAGVEVTDGNGNKVEEKSADDELFHSIFGYDLMTEKALQNNEKEENIIDEIASILDTL